MKALGQSKWTKIEHFLCSSLSMTWRGWALIFDQTMANVIESTKPLSGFKGRTALASTDHPEGFVAFGGSATLKTSRHSFMP
jgi:hypothetical protein